MLTELTEKECEQVLQSQHYGHLGCSDDGEPYVVPVTYLFRNGAVFGQTEEGKKIDIMRKNPRVCMQVEHIRTGFDWESVQCFGRFGEVTDAKEAHAVSLLLAEQFGDITKKERVVPVSPPIKDTNIPDSRKMSGSVVYRITIERMTGRSEKP